MAFIIGTGIGSISGGAIGIVSGGLLSIGFSAAALTFSIKYDMQELPSCTIITGIWVTPPITIIGTFIGGVYGFKRGYRMDKRLFIQNKHPLQNFVKFLKWL
jgi:hypothetical protein